jgi:predicted GIY-YIG superfamily endonuclease
LFYVYLLRSQSHPDQRYTGLTEDLRTRLAKHNAGEVPHTSKYTPWELHSYLAFREREQATRFEHYLKSDSGRAFANRHFWSETCGRGSEEFVRFPVVDLLPAGS